MKSDGMGEIISSAAKKYVKSVESTNSEQHNQYTLSRGSIIIVYIYLAIADTLGRLI